MNLQAYQHLPSQIDPIAFSIGFFSVRWYSLMYVVGFLTIFMLLLWRIKRGEFEKIFPFEIMKDQAVSMTLDFLLVAMLGALLGGRLGFAIFYQPAHFLAHPLALISPFNGENGSYVGIYGMSYFGGVLGTIVASFFYAKFKKTSFLAWADFVVPALGAGYFFGRLGNFLNGELYGKVTVMPWGMYFPLSGDGFLRHPSQLYEALGEGLLVFILLWQMRNVDFLKGKLLLVYLGGYALMRFVLEFFREPEMQFKLFANFFSLGQILSMTTLVLIVFIFKKIKEH